MCMRACVPMRFAFVGIVACTCNGIPMRFEKSCALFRKRVRIRFRNMLRYIFAENIETLFSIAIGVVGDTFATALLHSALSLAGSEL